MQQLQNMYPGAGPVRRAPGDWAGEINGGESAGNTAQTAAPESVWQAPDNNSAYLSTPAGQLFPAGTMPGMQTGLPEEMIQSPVSVEEAYKGSLKAMLARNIGNYVVATFLVGTQGTVSWEGFLHDVGNDFITIYQPGRERYVVIDIYSLKYIEFYDTRRRAQCENMLNQNGWENHY